MNGGWQGVNAIVSGGGWQGVNAIVSDTEGDGGDFKLQNDGGDFYLGAAPASAVSIAGIDNRHASVSSTGALTYNAPGGGGGQQSRLKLEKLVLKKAKLAKLNLQSLA